MLEQRIHAHFSESIAVKQQAQAALTAMTAQLGQLMATVIQSGHKILACGNGGSAADAQHFAAELVNRFEVEKTGEQLAPRDRRGRERFLSADRRLRRARLIPVECCHHLRHETTGGILPHVL